MTRNEAKEKFATIKKANEILINKIDELKEYLETESFNMGEKELNKYYNLKNNEKAQNFKKEYEKKTDLVNAKVSFVLENLKENETKTFLTTLVNNYAKMEDSYFEVLNLSKNEKLTASTLFKCEVMLDYYKNNLFHINGQEEAFNKKLNSMKEMEF